MPNPKPKAEEVKAHHAARLKKDDKTEEVVALMSPEVFIAHFEKIGNKRDVFSIRAVAIFKKAHTEERRVFSEILEAHTDGVLQAAKEAYAATKEGGRANEIINAYEQGIRLVKAHPPVAPEAVQGRELTFKEKMAKFGGR